MLMIDRQTKTENSPLWTFYGVFTKMKKKKRALSDCPPWSVQVAVTKDFSLDSLKTMQMNWSQFERVGTPQPRHQVKAFLPAEGRETPTGLRCESSYFIMQKESLDLVILSTFYLLIPSHWAQVSSGIWGTPVRRGTDPGTSQRWCPVLAASPPF